MRVRKATIARCIVRSVLIDFLALNLSKYIMGNSYEKSELYQR